MFHRWSRCPSLIGAPYYYASCLKNRTQFPLADILHNHGATLRSLSLKQRESEEPQLRRPMLSLADISAIHEACPNLSHLSLDIDRNETAGWPNATLDAITDIQTLESLTLRLEIGADLPLRRQWRVFLESSGP